MIHPTQADIGRKVVHRRLPSLPADRAPPRGVIVGLGDDSAEVLVRYTPGGPGIATLRSDLEWVDTP